MALLIDDLYSRPYIPPLPDTPQFDNAVSRALTRRAQVEGRPPEAAGYQTAYIAKALDSVATVANANGIDRQQLLAANPQLGKSGFLAPGEVVFIPHESPVSAQTEKLIDDAVRFDREHPGDVAGSDANWQRVQDSIVGDIRGSATGQADPAKAAATTAGQISDWAIGNGRLRTVTDAALIQVKNEFQSGSPPQNFGAGNPDIVNGANGYTPPPVDVTVQTDLTRAINPVAKQADDDLQAAQNKLNRDKQALADTQAALMRLNNDMSDRGASVGKLNALRTLEARKTTQQRQVAADQQQINAATARKSAADHVLHSEQAKADQKTAQASAGKADQAYQALTATLPGDVKLKQGDILAPDQVARLDAKQQAAYADYLKAQSVANRDQARVNASVAAANRDYAQLQVYASGPQQHGTIALDAIKDVNKALSPLGIELRAPEATSTVDARNQFDLANQMLTYANAVADTAAFEVPALDANLKVDVAQKAYDQAKAAYDQWRKANPNLAAPGNRYEMDLARADGQLKQAKAAAAQPNTDLTVAIGYQRKLEGQFAGQQAQADLGVAQRNYDSWRKDHPALPDSDNPHLQALTTAEHNAAIANQRSDMLDAAFVSAYAQQYAAGKDAALVTVQSQVNQAQKTMCLAPDLPLMQKLNQAKAEAKQAHDSADRLTLQANGLSADFRVTLANDGVQAAQGKFDAAQTRYNDWRAANPNMNAPGNSYEIALTQAQGDLTRAKNALSAAQQDQGLAQYRLLMNDFYRSLPANLQDPKTDEDKAAFAQAFDKFLSDHKDQIQGEVLLRHLQAASAPRPDDKTPNSYDGQDAIADLTQQLDAEERQIDDRSWVRDGADWVGERFGDSRSEVRDQLQTTLGQLQDLERRKGGMSAAAYHDELRKLMGDYYWRHQDLMADELEADERWQTAGEIGRVVAATTVGIVTTVATGGNAVAGFGAAFATYELIDGAGDVIDKINGKDMYADGHSSLVGFAIDAIQGDMTTDHALATLKDTGFDAASSITTAGATTAGMRTSAMVVARLGSNSTTLFGRGLATAAGATAGQGVSGGGQLVLEASQLALDGKLFTSEGGSQMLKSTRQQGTYLATAPLAGFTAGALPLHRVATTAAGGARAADTPAGASSAATARLSKLGVTGQFLNDGVFNLASAELAAQVTEGRHMNDTDAIAAAFSTVPGTVMNLAFRPGGIGNVPESAAPASTSGRGLPEIQARKIAAYVVGARIVAAIIGHLTGNKIALSAISGQEASTAGYYRSALSKYAWLKNNHAMIVVYDKAARGDTAGARKLLDDIIKRAPRRGAAKVSPEQANDLRARINDIGEAGQRYRDRIGALGEDAQQAMPSIAIRQWDSPEDIVRGWLPSDVHELPDVANVLRSLNAEKGGPFEGMKPDAMIAQLLRNLDSLSEQDLLAANRRGGTAAGNELWPMGSLQSRLLETREAREAYRALYKLVQEALPHKSFQDEIDHRAAEGDVGGSMSPETLLGWLFKAGSFGFALNLFGSWLIQKMPATGASPTEWGAYAADPVRGLPVVYVQYRYLEALRNLTNFKNEHSYEEIKADPQLEAELKKLEAEKKKYNTAADWTSMGTAVANLLKGMQYLAEHNYPLAIGSFVQAASSVGWVAVQQTPKWLKINPSAKMAIRYSAIALGMAVPTAILIATYLVEESERKKGPSMWDLTSDGFNALVAQIAKLLPEDANGGTVACVTTVPNHRPISRAPALEGDPTRDPARFGATPLDAFWPNRFATVDGSHRPTATVSDIVAANLDSWLSPEQQKAALARGGPDHVMSLALDAFFRANPQFDSRLMDGAVTVVAGDPDTVYNGDRIRLGPQRA